MYLKAGRYDEFHDALASAEIAGEISEFHALNFRAILAMSLDSEDANDYLEMAEVVAASPHELATVAESRAAHDLLRGQPLAAATRCLTAIDHICQTEGLWLTLLIALHRLGDMATIDATLRRLSQLDDECATRIVALVSFEPALHGVCNRPDVQRLLSRSAS